MYRCCPSTCKSAGEARALEAVTYSLATQSGSFHALQVEPPLPKLGCLQDALTFQFKSFNQLCQQGLNLTIWCTSSFARHTSLLMIFVDRLASLNYVSFKTNPCRQASHRDLCGPEAAFPARQNAWPLSEPKAVNTLRRSVSPCQRPPETSTISTVKHAHISLS